MQPRESNERSDVVGLRDEARTWLQRAGRLVAACQDTGRDSPMTRINLESLRHKRDTLETKLAALDHHRGSRSALHKDRVRSALIDLRAAWATFVRTLERDAGTT